MSTTESKEFKVALCGFSDREDKALGSALKLSAVRPRRYVRWQSGQTPPDLCLINEDLPAGVQAWRDLCQHLRRADFPLIRIGLTAKDSSLYEGVKSVFVKRPVIGSRVLKALDDLVTEVYYFAPEQAIHDQMSEQVIADLKPAKTPARPSVAGIVKRILVVDDSESVRKMMEVRLTKEGHAVDFAETGEEAIKKAGTDEYDLIFLDVMLPGINGYDVSRQLKRDLRIKAPVIMLTGKTSRIDKLRGTLASADSYLTKPLAIDSLNETLKRYLH